MTECIISKPISPEVSGVADAGLPSPAAMAQFDEREAWCLDYTDWFIARSLSEGAPPADVRLSQRFENEFNSCKLDPEEYERQTRSELSEVRKTL